MAPSALPEQESSSSVENRLKILIPEKVSQDGLALLSSKYEIHQPKNLTSSALLSIIGEYHALIVRSATKVTAELLAAATNLKVVARAGVGVDNIDVEAATKYGVLVVNSPSGNIVAAAEHTIALLMSVARNVAAGDRGVRGGGWAKERSSLVGEEVGGKVLGIIGLGKVGAKVARLGVGLGMKVIAMDPYASPDIAASLNVALVPDLKTLLPLTDFLTIHTPLIASTLDLISTAEFALMKPTAKVLNVARGGVYNEAALLLALNEGTIAGAGLDVFTSEPPLPDSPAEALCRHPRVVATPHLGASTVEAQENVILDVCGQVATVLSGGFASSAINAPLIAPEEYSTLLPFVSLLEKMGSLYTQYFKGDGGRRFSVTYEGELASLGNTKPLFAALIKGLIGNISEGGPRGVNIVNAGVVAKEKGIVVSEVRRGGERGGVYASLVTLRASGGADGSGGRVIEGFVSGEKGWIARLGRFSAGFVAEGNLVVLHNFDEPGKIGGVGGILGRRGVNIRFMSVASLDKEEKEQLQQEEGKEEKSNEALMILGVEGDVSKEVVDELRQEEGILGVSVVRL
ncbi:phosphoglycerate dehydrogenase [Bisporella sp. PMI_857]|nr:phosphoglycerate dehydrogenase [Bisporella sp. PMI_857]